MIRPAGWSERLVYADQIMDEVVRIAVETGHEYAHLVGIMNGPMPGADAEEDRGDGAGQRTVADWLDDLVLSTGTDAGLAAVRLNLRDIVLSEWISD